MDCIISPVTIDLGGKNTGLFLAQYAAGDAPDASHCLATTLVLPEEGGGITWSQKSRTATRHRVRGNKRRKLAKRLINHVFFEGLNRPLDQAEQQALHGLLNRRGYNRLERERDTGILERIDPYWFAEALPDYFTDHENLQDQLDRLCQQPDILRRLQMEALLSQNKNEFRKNLGSDYDAGEKKALTDAFDCIKGAITDSMNQIDYGHKHRRDYLKAIAAEIRHDTRLKKLREQLGERGLLNLIGNISNFQLRTLRWYFNDPAMQQSRAPFNNKRLHQCVQRWVYNFHPKEESERENRRKVLKKLDEESDILKALREIDPEWTIPPYEDQNNRRPPKDYALWLSPTKMEKHYGESWRIWAQKLMRANPDYAEGIDEILQQIDRNSRRKQEIDKDKLRHGYFLQRLLDRNKKLDDYALRELGAGRQSHRLENAHARLERDLGGQHMKGFLKFCRAYYDEVTHARQGTWFESERNLLERCDLNPPHKKRILHILVGNLLGEPLNPDQFKDFINRSWRRRHGRPTLMGLCRDVEETRKEYGNSFNERLKRLQYRLNEGHLTRRQLRGDDKRIWQAHEKTTQAAEIIAGYFTHTDEQKGRYDNPYSIAQLYTLIETDRHGFSSSTLATHQENNWRMQLVDLGEGEQAARCSRLPADSVRPFDGVLRRVLERQAWEIARIKFKQLQTLDIPNADIHIPIALEENRFTFTLSLVELKKAGTNRINKIKKIMERAGSPWLDKNERIKQASKDICPYTGNGIGRHGERDHIIPRSYSTNSRGTIYNSEANLIWCSRDGNQKKGNQLYTLSDLAPAYLRALYGTDAVDSITQTIENRILPLTDIPVFEEINDELLRDLRHALFLPRENAARQKAEQLLATQQRTRVNGTQAWLAKRIIQFIEELAGDWCRQHGHRLRFSVCRVDSREVSAIRQLLGEHNTKLAKPEPQPVASHAIDALCVLAQAAALPAWRDAFQLSAGLSEDMAWLARLLPAGIDIKRITSRPLYDKKPVSGRQLFKEGIYAENFLTIWYSRDGIRIGFEPNRAVPVEGRDPQQLLNILKPVLSSDVPEEAPAKPVRLVIHKTRAIELLHKVAKQPTSEDELTLADVLDVLRYCTSKKEIQSKLLKSSEREFKKKDDILKDGFTITLDINRKLGLPFVVKKSEITLPSKADWQRLCEHPQLAVRLGTKLEKDEYFDWHGLQEAVFRPGSKRAHGKTRRIFSLPVKDDPSGGFRIRRRTPDGNAIWQLHATEATYKAFAVVDGNIDWNRPVPMDYLLNSPDVSGLGQRHETVEKNVPFGQWLTVADNLGNGILRVDMAPGTKDRRYIRIHQATDQFFECLKAGGVDIDSSDFLQLDAEIKLPKDKRKRFNEALGYAWLGKPRSNLFIETLGKIIEYWYIVESSNQEMNQYYQKAYTELVE